MQSRAISIFEWIYLYVVDFLAKYFDHFKQTQFVETKALAVEIVQHQNGFLKQREKINDLIKKHFRVIDSNVDNLDEAEVICFGETHTQVKHRIANAFMIDALCEKEDMILVEHDEKDPSFRCEQAKYVQHPLEVRGWDIANDDSLKQYTDAFRIKIDSVESAMRYLVFGLPPESQERKIRKAVQRIYDEVPERNRHMCKTVDQFSLKGRRVYIIAGSDHLRPSKYSKDKPKWLDKTPQDKAYRETLNYLKTKKFAILTPKSE